MTIEVGEGARLCVRGVAASLALPGRDGYRYRIPERHEVLGTPLQPAFHYGFNVVNFIAVQRSFRHDAKGQLHWIEALNTDIFNDSIFRLQVLKLLFDPVFIHHLIKP